MTLFPLSSQLRFPQIRQRLATLLGRAALLHEREERGSRKRARPYWTISQHYTWKYRYLYVCRSHRVAEACKCHAHIHIWIKWQTAAVDVLDWRSFQLGRQESRRIVLPWLLQSTLLIRPGFLFTILRSVSKCCQYVLLGRVHSLSIEHVQNHSSGSKFTCTAFEGG